MVISKDSALRNITNVFIYNLALTDLCTALMVMPFWIVSLYSERWIFSTEICEWSATMQGICATVSGWTMAGIAVNRWVRVARRNVYSKFFPSMARTVIYCVMMWAFFVLLASPPLYGWGRVDYHQRAALCTLVWKIENLSYAMILVAIPFGMSYFIITICYYKIYRKVRASSSRMRAHALSSGMSSTSLSSAHFTRPRDIRILKVNFTVVCAYTACWVPGVLVILSETIFGPPPGFVNTIVVFLVFCSSGVNPIIYGVMNPQFKKAFRSTLNCKSAEEGRAQIRGFSAEAHGSGNASATPEQVAGKEPDAPGTASTSL